MMEQLNAVWTAMTTTNEELINVLIIPSSFIEAIVTTFLFTSILDIKTNRKQIYIYVILISIFSIISNWFIPNPFNVILNMIIWPVLVHIILKTSILKSILSEILPLVIGAILEITLLKIYYLFFHITQDQAYSIPIYRLSFIITIYCLTYVLAITIKKIHFNITILDSMSLKSKKLILLNFIFLLLSFILQAFLISFYIDNLPISITIIATITLLGYYGISIYSLIKTTKLEITTLNLEQSKQYNKTLTILHDNIRGFRHDFNNIITTIGGYIHLNDMDGLKDYYSQLLDDCKKSNNLSTLNPNIINNPAIYCLLTNKYNEATELGINLNIECFLDFNKINMKIYEFTRILGILLDNAIEAAKETNEKSINIIIRKDFNVSRQLLIIENSYKNKNIDTEQIYEKGFSSKPNNTGLGLWEVRQILKHNNNLNLFTSKTNDYFKQQLEIYC